jgi:hypothetical protein
MKLNRDFIIEYVDDTWLHLHHSAGMSSVLMGRKRFPKFVDFLKSLKFRKQGDVDSKVKVGTLTFLAEGPDEGWFNVFIDVKNVRLIFPVHLSQINDLVQHFSCQSK